MSRRRFIQLFLLFKRIKKNLVSNLPRRDYGSNFLVSNIMAVFPILFVTKALTKGKNSNIIQEADSLYDDARYSELYSLLDAHHSSEDPEILWRAARATFEKSKSTNDDKEKLVLLEEALKFVDKALELNEQCWAAHKWRAILLDYVWRYKSTRERIIHSFEVKKHMERAIELNPKDGTSYYLLGEWCYTFADMPWYQRKAAAAIFASPPTSTYEVALGYFETAEKVEPLFYSMNLLMIAKCYLKLNNREKAASYFKKVLEYSIKTPDDQKAQKEAEKFIKDLKD